LVKIADLNYSPLFGATIGVESPRRKFAEIFGVRKQESLSYRMALFALFCV